LCRRHKKGTQETEALGRSRGGFTTKLHARCDARGRPLGFVLTPGQTHDVQGFAPLFRMISDRIEAFLADRGYDADAIREEIAKAGVEAVIPAKSNRRNPAPHDRAKYKWRNLIERLFNKLKNWRRVATRYDKTRESYLGFVALASIKLWIPFVHETNFWLIDGVFPSQRYNRTEQRANDRSYTGGPHSCPLLFLRRACRRERRFDLPRGACHPVMRVLKQPGVLCAVP